MEKIARLWDLGHQPSLEKESLQRGPWKRCISDRSRIVRIEIGCMLLQSADGVVITPPQIVLMNIVSPGSENAHRQTLPKKCTTTSLSLICERPPSVRR
jgi:hypothetical protein